MSKYIIGPLPGTSSSGSGGGQVTPLSLVYSEEFTGNGSDVVFTLDGSVTNATYASGSWALIRVATTLPSDITTDQDGAIYDSWNIFTRHRISVVSINAVTGEVTLDYPPRLNAVFKVWYWYTLRSTDVLSFYYRAEYVSKMEGDVSSGDVIAAQNVAVNTTSFSGILSNLDDDVQKALQTIDTHSHVGPSGSLSRIEIEGLYKTAYNGKYVEFSYTLGTLTQIDIWDSDLKGVKLFTKIIGYDLNDNIDSVIITDETNSKTLTKIFTYDLDGNLVDKEEIFA